MALTDFLFGDTDDAIDRARRDADAALRRGKAIVDNTIAVGRAERAAVTTLIQREVENARAIGNLKDPLQTRAATAGIRARVQSERRAALAAAGATGASAAVDVAVARGVGEALDAERSVRIRRTAQSTAQISALIGQLGSITQAGFAAEIGAANAEAARGVESALQIGQAGIAAASQKNRALLGAIGGAIATGGIGTAFSGFGSAVSRGASAVGSGLEFLVPDVVEDFFAQRTLDTFLGFGGGDLFG